jgi:hypothetical protein
MVQFRQYEETLCDWGLNLRYFLAEVLQKGFLFLPRGLPWLFADDSEAFVEFGEDRELGLVGRTCALAPDRPNSPHASNRNDSHQRK